MGGKSSPPPPDYSGLERLGREQLDFAKQQYAEIMPFARQVYGTQMAAQEQQMAAQRQQMEQAQDYYNYMQQTFRPLERGLVADAQKFSTEGYREQLAREAAAAASQAFGQTQAMSQRTMAARGVNPNSPAGVALAQQANLGLAAQRAGAMTGARQQAEQMGWARRMDVTGLGRGLAGASLGAYQGATGAGSAAVGAGTAGLNTMMAPGSQFQQGLGQAGQTMSTITGQQAASYNAAMQNQGLDIGGLMAGGAKLYTAFGSDRRLKESIELVGRDERTQLPLYEFEYKGGTGRRFLGVMADDVEKVCPQAVFTMPDGFKAVDYAMLGIEMIEVTHEA